MKSIRLFEWGGGQSFFYQWGRLKRREKNLQLLTYLAWTLHLIFWLLWIFLIVPYPIALTVPVDFDLGRFAMVKDFLWPIFNLFFLALNTWLIALIYDKDILVSWLLLGFTLLAQIITLGITLSLIVLNI